MVRKSAATRPHHGESLTRDASPASREPGADGRRGRAVPPVLAPWLLPLRQHFQPPASPPALH